VEKIAEVIAMIAGVKVAAADPAGERRDQNLPRSGNRFRHVFHA
jgi:hypothetical protein